MAMSVEMISALSQQYAVCYDKGQWAPKSTNRMGTQWEQGPAVLQWLQCACDVRAMFDSAMVDIGGAALSCGIPWWGRLEAKHFSSSILWTGVRTAIAGASASRIQRWMQEREGFVWGAGECRVIKLERHDRARARTSIAVKGAVYVFPFHET